MCVDDMLGCVWTTCWDVCGRHAGMCVDDVLGCVWTTCWDVCGRHAGICLDDVMVCVWTTCWAPVSDDMLGCVSGGHAEDSEDSEDSAMASFPLSFCLFVRSFVLLLFFSVHECTTYAWRNVGCVTSMLLLRDYVRNATRQHFPHLLPPPPPPHTHTCFPCGHATIKGMDTKHEGFPIVISICTDPPHAVYK